MEAIYTIEQLRERLNPVFLKNNVRRATLFGSYSRGAATPDSDVDILVDLDKSAHMGLFEYVELQLALQDLLHRPVDLVERDSLMPFARQSANRDKILIYERA